jgi:hypothetical protein
MNFLTYYGKTSDFTVFLLKPLAVAIAIETALETFKFALFRILRIKFF